MEHSKELLKSIDKSVLCWLATVSQDGIPNVSPKEIFRSYKLDKIIIANIASPQTVTNIRSNTNVCLSFVDILVQKGFQLKGTARILNSKNQDFLEMKKLLEEMTNGMFPFQTITEITIKQSKPIIAPGYLLFPETTEEQQIANAKKTYLL